MRSHNGMHGATSGREELVCFLPRSSLVQAFITYRVAQRGNGAEEREVAQVVMLFS